MTAKRVQITEHIQSPPTKVSIEEGVIYGAKMLGRVSKNGREYSDQAMRDAARLYEGAVINIDHPDAKEGNKPRGFLEGVAVAQKTRIEGDYVVGDLHAIKAHPASGPLLEWASRFPDKFGLSHNADGLEVSKGGKRVIESLDRVISVDVVRNPATVKNLFESEQPMSKKTIRQIIEAEFPKTYKGAGLLEMDGMADMPVEVAADSSSSEDQIWGAFKTAIMTAVDDDKLDTKATLKKIGDILKAYEKLANEAGGGSGDTKDPAETLEGDAVTKQIGQLLESKIGPVMQRLEKFERRDMIRTLCEQHQLTPDSELLAALNKLPDEAAMKSLLEREAKLRPRGRNKPLVESVGGQGGTDLREYPKDSKGFVSAISGR